MKTIIPFTIMIVAIACSSIKRTSQPDSLTHPYPAFSYVFVTPAPGIYLPGEDELNSIRLQFPETTLNQLKEGYSIYTEGACIQCHNACNIYDYTEIRWKSIIDIMAEKAQITAAQKDAVYKYVLSIKAVQPPRALPDPVNR